MRVTRFPEGIIPARIAIRLLVTGFLSRFVSCFLLTTLSLLVAVAPFIPAIIAASLIVLGTLLLRLLAAFLLGPLVQCGGEILERGDKVDAEVALGFVGFLDAFGDTLDGTGEVLEVGVDALEAGGDAAEKFVELVVGIGAHDGREGGLVVSEWAQESG
jgi:hypothetical protein